MANEGFKGDRINIGKLTIQANPAGIPVLQCAVQFTGEDGTVHAVANHSFLLDGEVTTDGLAVITAELLKVVTKLVEMAHFLRPNDQPGPVFQGIAEIIHAMPTATDEPGSQG